MRKVPATISFKTKIRQLENADGYADLDGEAFVDYYCKRCVPNDENGR